MSSSDSDDAPLYTTHDTDATLVEPPSIADDDNDDSTVPTTRAQAAAAAAAATSPPPSTCRRVTQWALLLLFSPLLLGVFVVWWVMGRVRLLAFLEAAIIAAVYTAALTNASTSKGEQDFSFHSSLSDVLLVVCLRALAVLLFASVYRHRSRVRRSLILGLALLSTGYQAAKIQAFGWGPYDDRPVWSGREHDAHVLLVLPMVLAWLVLGGEFWVPTSIEQMHAAEDRLLKTHGMRSKMQYWQGHAAGISYYSSGGQRPDDSAGHSVQHDKPVLVLLHGFGAGKALYVRNVEVLARHFHVYSLDWLGSGRSDRPRFRASNVEATETWFCDAFEKWRIAHNYDKIFLLGHSFGGYLAAVYALTYPERVEQLILASPVGLPDPPPPGVHRGPFPWFLRSTLAFLWSRGVTPQSMLRFFGPLGPSLSRKALTWRLKHVRGLDLDCVVDYVYHINAGPPSGERALNRILAPGAWARAPLAPRLEHLECPTTFIYGSHDWMDSAAGRRVSAKLRRKGVRSQSHILPGAGHQVFLENPDGFNDVVLGCLHADDGDSE